MQWLCWLAMILLTGMAALSLYILLNIYDLMHGRHGSLASMKVARQYLLTGSSVAAIVIVILSVLFLLWIHRISTNAHAMGAEGLHFRPGASVALFFVPFLNLVLPPVMIDELYRVALSIPEWRTQKRSLLVPGWWLLQLTVGIGGVALILTGRGENLEDTWRILIWQVVYIAVTMPYYIALPSLVGRITNTLRRQQRMAPRSRERLDEAAE